MNLPLHILNSVNAGIVYADNDHIIRYMDPRAEAHFKSNLVGRNLLECHRPGSTTKIKEYHNQMLEGKLEEILVRKMDKLQAYMKAVRNDEGQLIGYMEIFKPISQGTTIPVKENLYQKSYLYYDALYQNQRSSGDIDFFKKVIPQEASVLEIGCGTGRIGLELAKRGNKMVGLDLSKEMLSLYHEKIVDQMEHIQGTVKTSHQDMVSFSLNQTFDYIIFPFRVFQMLLTDKFRVSCLESVKRHLNPEGKIILNVFNPKPEAFEDWSTKRYEEAQIESELLNGTLRRTFVGERHFEKQQIISYKNIYELVRIDQEPISFEEPMRLSYFYEEQLTNFLIEQGFKVEALYGDWHFGAVVSEEKNELIYILTRAS